jgi:hypothetical protein
MIRSMFGPRLPTYFKVRCILFISVAIGILCTYTEPAVASLRPLADRQSLPDPIPRRYSVRVQTGRRTGESAESVGRADPAGDTYITTSQYPTYVLVLHATNRLQILTEKGDQRL